MKKGLAFFDARIFYFSRLILREFLLQYMQFVLRIIEHTEEEMKSELNFYIAEKIIQDLFLLEDISLEEYRKIRKGKYRHRDYGQRVNAFYSFLLGDNTYVIKN